MPSVDCEAWAGCAQVSVNPVVALYTGKVVKIRCFALVLALLSIASPVLGLVCQMDCDQPPAAATCHESNGSPHGPTVRAAHHACDHDHTSGSPALLTAASPRDSLRTFIAV